MLRPGPLAPFRMVPNSGWESNSTTWRAKGARTDTRRPQRDICFRTGPRLELSPDRSGNGRSSFLHPLRGRRPGNVGEGGSVSSAPPLLWRWKLTAKRWASSRRRRSKTARRQLLGSLLQTAVTRSGARNTSSARLAGSRPTTSLHRASSEAHAGPSITRRELAPCPSSIITTFGPVRRDPIGVGKRGVSPWRRSSARFRPFGLHPGTAPENGRRMISAIAMKSSEWPGRDACCCWNPVIAVSAALGRPGSSQTHLGGDRGPLRLDVLMSKPSMRRGGSGRSEQAGTRSSVASGMLLGGAAGARASFEGGVAFPPVDPIKLRPFCCRPWLASSRTLWPLRSLRTRSSTKLPGGASWCCSTPRRDFQPGLPTWRDSALQATPFAGSSPGEGDAGRRRWVPQAGSHTAARIWNNCHGPPRVVIGGEGEARRATPRPSAQVIFWSAVSCSRPSGRRVADAGGLLRNQEPFSHLFHLGGAGRLLEVRRLRPWNTIATSVAAGCAGNTLIVS